MQVGVPSEREQYIHRVGRTARAGKQGQSVLLLADFEAYFLRQLTGHTRRCADANTVIFHLDI